MMKKVLLTTMALAAAAPAIAGFTISETDRSYMASVSNAGDGTEQGFRDWQIDQGLLVVKSRESRVQLSAADQAWIAKHAANGDGTTH